MSVILILLSDSNFVACTTLYSFTNFVNVFEVVFLKNRQKAGTVILTKPAISSKLICWLKFSFICLNMMSILLLSWGCVSKAKPSAFKIV
jgi:hypothetical protein